MESTPFMFDFFFYYTAQEGKVKKCPMVVSSFLSAQSNRACPMALDDNRRMGSYCRLVTENPRRL